MHVVHIMANNSSVPYFNWFAEEIQRYPDHQFSFIALYPQPPQMLQDMAQRGCKCYWLPFDDTKRKSSMIRIIPKLVKLLRQIKPNGVNTHLFDDSFPGLIAARLAGIKIRAITKGDTTYHWNFAPKWVWADKLNNLNATHIIAISNESKEFILTKEKAAPQKVYMIHHGIPLEKATASNKQFEKELIEKYDLAGYTVIGTVARLIEWKGYRYIIKAAAKLVNLIPNLKFVFAGVGDQEAELKSLVAKHGLQNHVVFTGWVDRNYIPSLYKIMDIYLHAATQEPFGFVIAEAMANGLPLVTTKTGAAADALIHKQTAYFVDEKNPDQIVDGINWILADDDRRLKISRESAILATQLFDVKKMVKNYLTLYNLNPNA